MVDKGGDVIGHQPDVDWSIDVSGTAMSLQVGGNDLVALRQLGQHGPEHLARHEPAVEEDQRPPGTMRLVVEIEAVDLGVLAGGLGVSRGIGGHGQAPYRALEVECRNTGAAFSTSLEPIS